MTDTNQLLKTAVQAAKAGDREKAHQLLLQIVEQDETNETAWLWLSGTVQTREERQICLENVLAINPNNEIAKKGLQKLGVSLPQASPPAPVEKEPERWDKPVYDLELPAANDPHQHKFDDAWSSSADLCAYCAQPVTRRHKRCPKCQRKMVGKEPIYPNRTHHLQNWIVFRSIGHILYVLEIVSLYFVISFLASHAVIPWEAFKLFRVLIWIFLAVTLAVTVGLTVALYFRQVWAYWLAILGLLLVIISNIGSAIWAPPESLTDFFPTWNIIAASLFYIVFQVLNVYFTVMAAGDFRREKQWRVAVVDQRVKDPLVLDKAGKLFAQRGMWATAVLYWQRAVGRSPGNVAVLRRLADGYARLGFPERSLDTLHQARDKTLDPDTKAVLTQQMELLNQKLVQQTKNLTPR
ncbi:MAG: hypothetical protein IPM53_16195 [Anaerolineaceae bacterium]|nr:hypothetical protein [Anaerolineaceae bacterium]